MELARAGGLTDAHFEAIRAVGINDAGQAQMTQTGFGRNTEHVQVLADEAKSVLGGYYREFTYGNTRPGPASECDCPGDGRWRNGIVLDPFGGSGTVGAVASGHSRDSILIDIDERNADLARQRVGMFLTVETHPR